jgi:hypothetical protein
VIKTVFQDLWGCDMKKIPLVFLFLFLASPALAGQFPPAATGNLFDLSPPVSIGTSAVQVAPVNLSRQYLVIQNESSTASVGCNTAPNPQIGTPGTITLLPYGSWAFSGNFVPTAGFWCVASIAATPVTIKEGHQ